MSPPTTLPSNSRETLPDFLRLNAAEIHLHESFSCRSRRSDCRTFGVAVGVDVAVANTDPLREVFLVSCKEHLQVRQEDM